MMASRWFRWYNFTTYSSYLFQKAIALFLNKCMDFTVQANVSTNGDWFSTEKNGTTGAFGGSDWNFTDSSAPFVSSDRDKFIVIKDNTNPKNAGVYRIRRFNSSTSVEIDFLTCTDEFPAASTGLSWWIFAGDYQLPDDYQDDYCRLKSRHTTEWAIQLQSWQNSNWLTAAVSVDGTWETSGRILGSTETLRPRIEVGVGLGRDYVLFMEGDYDGGWLTAWGRKLTEGWTYNQGMPFAGWMIARLDNIVESGKTEYEKIVLTGGNLAIPAFESNYDTSSIGKCRYWFEETSEEKEAYMIDASYFGYVACFVKNAPMFQDGQIPEMNKRIGSPTKGKLPLTKGTYVLADPNNTDNLYHMLGRMKGHWRMNIFRPDPASGSNAASRTMTPVDLNGTRDLMIIADGFVINWNGYTNGGY